MIVHHDDAPSPPACWNHEEAGPDFAWAKPGCHQWAPGIGQPTAEYPSGTPYPIAHGWAKWCALCKHAPAEIGAFPQIGGKHP